MNNDQFLQRLSEVAEWHRPQTGPNGAASVNKRARTAPQHPGVITPAQLDDMSDEEAQEYHDQLMLWSESQPNQSVPPQITRVLCCTQQCEDCDRTVQGRHVEIKRHDTGRPHWRRRCRECGFFQDPRTGAFDIDVKIVHMTLGNWYRRTTPAPVQTQEQIKTKKQLRLEQLAHRQQQRAQQAAQVMAQLHTQTQYHMVPYDAGDSVVWRREPIQPPADT